MVRIVLSLVMLISTLAVITTNGCGNTSVSIEERKTMPEIVNSIQDGYMNEGYKTATFALG